MVWSRSERNFRIIRGRRCGPLRCRSAGRLRPLLAAPDLNVKAGAPDLQADLSHARLVDIGPGTEVAAASDERAGNQLLGLELGWLPERAADPVEAVFGVLDLDLFADAELNQR